MDAMDNQERLLREALEPDPDAVERLVSSSLAVVRGGRVRAAASMPLASGRGKSGGSSLRRAASKPRLARYGVVRWAAVVGVLGFGLGLWLSSRVPSASTLLIANEGTVYTLRDAHGLARLLNREALLDPGTVRSGDLMFLFHGGVR